MYREELDVPSAADMSREAAAGATTAAVAADPDPVVQGPNLPRERQRKAKASWRCQRCWTSVTPCHRPGPAGKATLCNGMFGGDGGAEGRTGYWAGGSFLARSGRDICRVAGPQHDIPAV